MGEGVGHLDEGFGDLSDGALLAVIDGALDVLCGDRVRLGSGREQLELLTASLRVDARLRAWQARLAAHVETTEVAWREHGTSASTWLADTAQLTRREAARLVAAGERLQRFGVIAAAARSGAVLPGQVEAITGVLDNLPDDLPGDTVECAQELMVGFAATHNSAELRRLSAHLLECLAPEAAEGAEAARVEREHRQAVRNRHLSFVHDYRGSVLIRGSLPVAEAEPFIKMIDAYTAAAGRGLDAADPAGEYLSPGMRRADALTAMVNRHAHDELAPAHGGDRPRAVVTLSYDKLAKAAADGGGPIGGHLAGGDPVPAGVLRRWLCDADVLPVVLAGASQVLDVGRAQRLVTAAMRAALDVRDRGCVFVGCDKPPTACQAHHIRPWWAGGATALSNLVLACPHHHGIIEPGHDPDADRWQVRLTPDGIPEILPPRRVDPHQQPRVHARFLTPQRR